MLAGVAALLTAVVLAGCATLDFDLVADAVFPPRVPGLPDGPWLALPVDVWVQEGGVRARAMEACFAPGCPEPAAIGLFVAERPEALAAFALAARPADLVAALLRPAMGGRRSGTRTANAPVRLLASAEPLADPGPAGRGWTGFVLAMSRADGSRAFGGAFLVAPPAADGRAHVVLAIAGTERAASRLAQDVAAALP